jgi:hypothetical protein
MPGQQWRRLRSLRREPSLVLRSNLFAPLPASTAPSPVCMPQPSPAFSLLAVFNATSAAERSRTRTRGVSVGPVRHFGVRRASEGMR